MGFSGLGDGDGQHGDGRQSHEVHGTYDEWE